MVAETDGDLREQIIKDHFSQRIAELTMQLQTADSKALHFHAEVSVTPPDLIIVIKHLYSARSRKLFSDTLRDKYTRK